MWNALRILLAWRRPILVFGLLGAIGAGVWAFTATPRYYAQASILPPNDNNAAFGGLSALLQQYQVPIPGGVGTPFLPTLYASIVGSRRMGTQILDEFALRPVFRASTETDALTLLRRRTFLKYTEEGLFLIGYEDSDAGRGAAIVNAYVRHLDEIIQQVNAARATQTREFVESQIERCSNDLQAAEEAMRDFQREHRAVQIDQQTEGALDIAAALQGRILGAQVELEMLRQKAYPTAPEVQQKSEELRALRRQYDALVASSPRAKAVDRQNESLFPSFDSVPDLALQYLRRMRDLKIQETLFGLLTQQLEQARIEERKNTPVLSVLDQAVPGEIAVYPRKMLVIGAAAVAAMLWAGLFALFAEAARARRVDAADAQEFSALVAEWRTLPKWARLFERLIPSRTAGMR